MDKIKNFYFEAKAKKIIKFLRMSDPKILVRLGEKSLIPSFRRAIKMPAYAGLLKAKEVDYKHIKNIESFKKNVPVFTKEDFFADFDVSNLCIGGNLDSMRIAMSSSGMSGLFSYGINTAENQEAIAHAIDIALDYAFEVSKKKTLLINCLPVGMRIFTRIPIAEASVRSDMALAIIKKFSSHFQQTILIGDPHFLKKLIEEGLSDGIDFKNIQINLILSQDWFSESFRSYLSCLVGIDINDAQTGLIGSTMGIIELGLNLFHETVETVRLRHKAQRDPALMKKLFGKELKICPIIFQYYPNSIFLETTNSHEVVFSMLNKNHTIPLIRYNSKDIGFILSYNNLKRILIEEQLSEELIPDLKLPLIALSGRQGRCLTIGEKTVTPEEIKQGLYDNFKAANSTTGYFRLSKESNNAGKIEVQLKKGVKKSPSIKQNLSTALLEYSAIDLRVVIYNYHEFPYAMELDYERKFYPV